MTTIYEPDGWIIIKCAPKNEPDIYKVFGSWNGSFIAAEHWRLSSGGKISDIKGDKHHYLWPQHSGSQYVLNKCSENQLCGYNRSVIEQYLNLWKENNLNVEYVAMRDIVAH